MKPFKIILLNILILFAVAILFEGLNYVVYYFKTKETLELKNSAGFLQKLRYTKAQKFSTKNFVPLCISIFAKIEIHKGTKIFYKKF